MVQFRVEIQHVAVVFQCLAVIGGEGNDQLPRPVRIFTADKSDGIQCIVEKMRVHLGLEGF